MGFHTWHPKIHHCQICCCSFAQNFQKSRLWFHPHWPAAQKRLSIFWRKFILRIYRLKAQKNYFTNLIPPSQADKKSAIIREAQRLGMHQNKAVTTFLAYKPSGNVFDNPEITSQQNDANYCDCDKVGCSCKPPAKNVEEQSQNFEQDVKYTRHRMRWFL